MTEQSTSEEPTDGAAQQPQDGSFPERPDGPPDRPEGFPPGPPPGGFGEHGPGHGHGHGHGGPPPGWDDQREGSSAQQDGDATSGAAAGLDAVTGAQDEGTAT